MKNVNWNFVWKRNWIIATAILAILVLIIFLSTAKAERNYDMNLRQGRLSTTAGFSNTGAFCVEMTNLDAVANATGGGSDAYAVVSTNSTTTGTIGFQNATQETSNFGVTIASSIYNKKTWIATSGLAYAAMTTKNSTATIGNWAYVTGDGSVTDSATKTYNSTLIGEVITNSTANTLSKVLVLLF